MFLSINICLTFFYNYQHVGFMHIITISLHLRLEPHYTAQKMKFSIKGFFSKYNQIQSLQRI